MSATVIKSLRVSETTWERVEDGAAERGLSVNAYAVALLVLGLELGEDSDFETGESDAG